MKICKQCTVGDHSYHSDGRLAFICIGCPCEWTPEDEEGSDESEEIENRRSHDIDGEKNALLAELECECSDHVLSVEGYYSRDCPFHFIGPRVVEILSAAGWAPPAND